MGCWLLLCVILNVLVMLKKMILFGWLCGRKSSIKIQKADLEKNGLFSVFFLAEMGWFCRVIVVVRETGVPVQKLLLLSLDDWNLITVCVEEGSDVFVWWSLEVVSFGDCAVCWLFFVSVALQWSFRCCCWNLWTFFFRFATRNLIPIEKFRCSFTKMTLYQFGFLKQCIVQLSCLQHTTMGVLLYL